ncbi:MAG: SagB/ThcOx family dehydrogenase [Candidatus Zixiibacteriota bacterium]
MSDKIGPKFQKQTRTTLEFLKNYSLDYNSKPERYKTYPDAERFELADFEFLAPHDFKKTVLERRSIRSYKDKPIDFEHLSYLIWASLAENNFEKRINFRAAPSAGARYPIEAYLVVHDVKDLPQGLYHYNVKDNVLELLKRDDFRDKLQEAAQGQKVCHDCQVAFLFSAIFERAVWKYKQRGYRYVYLDAGHIGHALSLAATSVDLGSVMIGAYIDEYMDNLAGLDDEKESIIYAATVAHPKS